jgi:hypothetical protein
MQIKFGSVVVDGRNKLGGHVLEKGGSGNYIRTNSSQIHTATLKQLQRRARVTFLAQRWDTLTAAQRLAWNRSAKNCTRSDLFGNTRAVDGFHLFMSCNLAINDPSLAVILVPAATPVMHRLVSISVLGNIAGNLPLTFSVSPVATNYNLYVEATPPIHPGITYVNRQFVQLVVIPQGTASPYGMSTAYDAMFGDVAPLGKRIWFRVHVYSTLSGLVGPILQTSCLIIP